MASDQPNESKSGLWQRLWINLRQSSQLRRRTNLGIEACCGSVSTSQCDICPLQACFRFMDVFPLEARVYRFCRLLVISVLTSKWKQNQGRHAEKIQSTFVVELQVVMWIRGQDFASNAFIAKSCPTITSKTKWPVQWKIGWVVLFDRVVTFPESHGSSTDSIIQKMKYSCCNMYIQ